MNNYLQMTKYFRDSIAAKLQIDFKNNNYEIVQMRNIQEGIIGEKHFRQLIKDKNINKIDIIIVAKTIKTIFLTQEKLNNNIEDLTGIFFIPAIFKSDGTLTPPEGKFPWIPREHLHPIIEEDLAIGHLRDYDDYLSNHHPSLKNNPTWDVYYNFSKKMFETITGNNFTDIYVNDIELENNVYIFKDDSIIATRNILKLYDHLLEGNYKKSILYQNFIKQGFNQKNPLINNTFSEMKKHTGQMGSEYPLSFSQRECVNHFNNMEEGEVLAVNGPPGTGKTTLLQSLVANLYVDKAIRKKKAPLIVASSTNNQAVTNIIESFGKIDKAWKDSNLEERWIEGVNSFAVYFPSKSKAKEADQKGFQHTTPKGDNFFTKLECEKNIQISKVKFLKACNIYFNTSFNSLEECEEQIWRRLNDVQAMSNELLSLFNQFVQVSNREKKGIDTFLSELHVKIEKSTDCLSNIQSRVDDWKNHFNSTPFYYRWLSFIPSFKKKMINRNRLFILPQEDFLNESMNLEKIIYLYSNKAKELRMELQEYGELYNKVNEINSKFKEVIEGLVKIQVIKDNKASFNSLEKLNEFLDTSLRYVSFWLAVHYYECRWIKGKRLTDGQKGKNFKNVLEQFYENLSMVAPCYVMTFFQLPKLFLAYDGKQQFLYNKIDLLIVDEAGQVTPEIAACSFSLAKRAVVVGDVYQIEPVWNINKSLDMSLAISAGVITGKKEFENLSNLGLNTSESSVMKIACKCCNYEKFGERGLFLSEHRRCYDEIIKYCNQLVYKGNLEPKRGLGENDDKYPLNGISIPHFGHIQVDSNQSSKLGDSRYNEKEAEAIAKWLNKYFYAIKSAYPKENTKDLIGIVTPFKMQVSVIKKALPPEIKNLVDVGTVHTFQGGERRVIIMSTVYGRSDGCYFIDASKSLLNVAVSRAKDSFIVFGELGCLSKSEAAPSGLLKKMVATPKVENMC